MKTLPHPFRAFVWVIGVYFFVQTVCAQSSQTYAENYQKATALWEAKNYQMAQLYFQKCTENAPHPTAYQQALAHLIICDKMLNYKSFVSSAVYFLEQFPLGNEASEIRFHLGDFYFRQGKYELAKSYLSEISLANPQTALQIEATYELGYALFALRKYDEAYQFFNLIKRKNHIYQNASWYYSGYIRYLNKEYEGAIRELKRVNESFDNQEDVYQLIAHILFLNQEYGRCADYIQGFMAQYPDNLPLNSLLGNSYFALQKYDEALPFLKTLLETEFENATLFFQIGMCLLKQQKSLEATEYLRFATELAPDNAQIWYHFGVACAKLKDKKYLTMAQEAFKNCRQPAEYMHLHELGALNYATMSHKLHDYTAVLEGCEFYRYHYPKGEFMNDINSLMLKAAMQGDDYFGAADYLQKIQDKTPEMKRAYQRILLNKAIELFDNQNFIEAYRTFSLSLNYPYEERLVHQANYWLAQIKLRHAEYKEALNHYFRIPEYAPEYTKSLYGIGYAHFQLHQYQKARLFFEDFLRLEHPKNKAQSLEVQARIADCQFAEQHYKQALQHYDMLLLSEAVAVRERGYFLLQKGLVLNQLHRFLEAILLFDEVITKFSGETYSDYAHWHQAVAYENISSYAKAIEPLNYLVVQARNRNLKPMALFKRGKIYLKTNDLTNAIDDFRRIIYQYPTDKNAIKALEKLEKLHDNGIEIAHLEQLVQQVGAHHAKFMELQLSDIEKDYRRKKDNSVIEKGEKFIARFPSSEFQNPIRYWMGVAFWNLKNKENALANLKRVRGEYQAKAQKKIHEIYAHQNAKKPIEKPAEEPTMALQNIEQLIQNKDFTNAKKQTYAHYHRHTIEGEKAVYYTMCIMVEERNWGSVEATFYEFKKRFPNSKKYYDAVLMLAESKIYTHKKTEAKGLIQEVLEHCRNRNTIIKAKTLLYKM